MGQHNLHRIFKPQKVAVIGASMKAGSIGNSLMENLLLEKFPGTVLPVNPKYSEIHGLPCCRTLSELGAEVDLAIIATPIHTIPQIIIECIEMKIGGAVVFAAGGKETGREGLLIEEKIRNIALPARFRIIGPNCLGIINPGARLNATFISGMPATGNMAMVSQSGAICSAILDLALKEKIGFSHFVSIGSMLDVDFGDMVDFLGNDPGVQSILLYIENLTNLRKFMSAARAVSRIKPIIVLKAGRSAAGAKAAASHTGAMVGEDEVYDAAFKRAGIARVDTIEELFDCAELMAKQPRPRGGRLAIVTNGGGPGVMAVDFLARNDQEPAPLDAGTMEKLDSVLPPCWSRNNPIDILGDASPERFRKVLQICLKARIFDGILVILAPQALTHPMEVAQNLVELMQGQRFPVFGCWMGGKSISEAVEFLNNSDIPNFDTPERAVRAFLHMVHFAANQKLLLETVPKLTSEITFCRQRVAEILIKAPPDGMLPEVDVRAILAAYNLPLVESVAAEDEEKAICLSREMGYPVVMKLNSPDISHKTEAGGVCLDLRSDADISTAYRNIVLSASRYLPDARIEGVTIQPCIADADFEIVLGAKRDADFGPVILFGAGGIFTEVLQDKALGLPPMNRLLARRLMEETRINTLLQGYRNRPPVKRDKLEEMIICLSQLLIDFPQISELDMNPVLIREGQPIVVDARLIVSEPKVASPMQLVISPYPEEYITRMVSEDGTHLLVRPIMPEDAPLFMRLFEMLSPTTIYHRFFGALKTIQPAMLSKFTQIDYDREIALVAIDEDSPEERMLGVARIIGDPDGEEGEIAVLIGDLWQGRGIGAGLMKRCLLIAEERGYRRVFGTVLRENTHMLALARKLGFSVTKGEDSGEFAIRINFGPPEVTKGLQALSEPQ